MKAAIVDTYLDTMGGGERYTLSFALALAEAGYEVSVEWGDKTIKKKLENRFGMDLKNIKVIPDVKRGDGYDVCFWVSDGSVPTLKARKNYLHFQVPFRDVNGRSLLNKMKMFRVNKVICNSLFTKKIIDEEYGVDSLVIYPPVDTLQFKPKRKENLIISVGRFSELLQNKRQDILIKVFKNLYDGGLKDWKLILAGGSEVGSAGFVENLRKSGEGYPIQILEGPSFNVLKDLYGKSKIFWSASGYDIDENADPQLVEHFGIAVVEAMSAGCVPFIFNSGGHKEIVGQGSGFLWETPQELERIFKELLKNKKETKEISASARKSSRKFSLERFKDDVIELVQSR
jgi:glycosyltransferase involved in cell wall biosynthesis